MSEVLNVAYMSAYLEQSFGNATRLLQLLKDERESIANSDATTLEGITSEKKHIARILESSTKECSTLLSQAEYEVGDKGMLDFFATCGEPHTSQMTTRWNELQDILKQCQEDNRINGQLLDNSQRRIKQAIGILQGQPTDQELYGRRGKTISQSLTNSLTQA